MTNTCWNCKNNSHEKCNIDGHKVHPDTDACLNHIPNDQHWTDNHIKWNDKVQLWIGFDETGSLHCGYPNKEQTKQSLIRYAKCLQQQKN